MKLKRGILFVVSAPAGTGKTTLVTMLTEEFPDITRSISYTTRQKRPGEVEGKDYFFIDQESFQKRIDNNEFLEYAKVFGNYYGSSKWFVEERCFARQHVILVIDTQGAMKLMEQQRDSVFIFLHPPSKEEQRGRLQKRSTESFEVIEERLSRAQEEIQAAKNYDYQIVNDNLMAAYGVLRSIVVAEEHRTFRFR